MSEEKKDRNWYSIKFEDDGEGGKALEIAGRLGEVYCRPGGVLIVSGLQLEELKNAKLRFSPVRLNDLEA